MGQAVLKAVQEADGLELVGAVDIKGGADTGSLVGLPANGILVETDLEALLARKKPEVMVDFTRPDVVFGNVMTALAHKTSPVVGTTGLSDEQKAEIAKAAEENDTPAFIAPNFAIGAVLLMVMSRQAAKYMPDVEIIELHHDKKLDAPSGTAIQTAAMIAEVRKAHKQGNPDEFEKLEGARGADYEGMHIHSVRLPDADHPPRLDEPRVLHAGRRARRQEGPQPQGPDGRPRQAARLIQPLFSLSII